MAAEGRRVGIAPKFGEAGDGVDAVVVTVGAWAVDLDQQVLAVGFDPGMLMTGERGELAL
jgi:hypothetical protein